MIAGAFNEYCCIPIYFPTLLVIIACFSSSEYLDCVTTLYHVNKIKQNSSGDISNPLEAPLHPKQVENLWLDVAKAILQRVKRLAFQNPAKKMDLEHLSYDLNKQYAVVGFCNSRLKNNCQKI